MQLERLYSWTGYARASAGEVRPRSGGGFDAVLEVSEIVWETIS